MNIKIGIFLLSAVCLQMCGLQGINDNNVAVQDQKPKGYVQRIKDFVAKYNDIIVPTIATIVGVTGVWHFFCRPNTDLSPRKTKINVGIDDERLNNLPEYHGQKVWLSDDAKAHLKQLLQRVCNGETNDPAGEFLRYLRKPGVLHMDQAGIRTITMRIDQHPEVAKALIRVLMYADILNDTTEVLVRKVVAYEKLLDTRFVL